MSEVHHYSFHYVVCVVSASSFHSTLAHLFSVTDLAVSGVSDSPVTEWPVATTLFKATCCTHAVFLAPG